MLTEKGRRIVALKKEGKTVREIVELTGSSFSRIKEAPMKAEEEERLVSEKKLEEQREASDKCTQALDLFSRGKSNIEVATSTGLRAERERKKLEALLFTRYKIPYHSPLLNHTRIGSQPFNQ